MTHRSEHHFAEAIFEKLALESLPVEQSAYADTGDDNSIKEILPKYRSKLKWHIRNSLSPRQREVIGLILKGKTEREISSILGVAQQVVHIYKWRAIRMLRKKLASRAVCQKTNSRKG